MDYEVIENLIRSERKRIEKRLNYLESLIVARKATDSTIEAVREIGSTWKTPNRLVTHD